MRSLERIVALLPWCSSVCLSVCPSVCPSVCLGRACTVIIRCTLARISVYGWVQTNINSCASRAYSGVAELLFSVQFVFEIQFGSDRILLKPNAHFVPKWNSLIKSQCTRTTDILLSWFIGLFKFLFLWVNVNGEAILLLNNSSVIARSSGKSSCHS